MESKPLLEPSTNRQDNKENNQATTSTSDIPQIVTKSRMSLQAPSSALKRARTPGESSNLGVTYALGAHDMTLPSPARVESLRKFAKAKGLATPSPGRASAAITMLQLTTGNSKNPPGSAVSNAANQSPLLLGPSTIGDICQTLYTYFGDRKTEIDPKKFAMDIGSEVDRVEDLISVLQLLGIMENNSWIGYSNLPQTLAYKNWNTAKQVDGNSGRKLIDITIAKLAELLIQSLVETFGLEPETNEQQEPAEPYSWMLESLVPLVCIAHGQTAPNKAPIDQRELVSKAAEGRSETEYLVLLQRLHEVVSVLVAVGLVRITKAALTLGQYRYTWSGLNGVHRALGWSPQRVAEDEKNRKQNGMPPPASTLACNVTPIEMTNKAQATPKSVMEGRRNSRAEVRNVVRMALHSRKLDGSGGLNLGIDDTNSSGKRNMNFSGNREGNGETTGTSKPTKDSSEYTSKTFSKFNLAALHEAAQHSKLDKMSQSNTVQIASKEDEELVKADNRTEVRNSEENVLQRPLVASAYFQHPLPAPLPQLGEVSSSASVTEAVLEASLTVSQQNVKETEADSPDSQVRNGRAVLPPLSNTGISFDKMPLPSEMLAYQTRCLKEFMKHYLIHYKRHDKDWVINELKELERRCELLSKQCPMPVDPGSPGPSSPVKDDNHMTFSQQSAGSLSSNTALPRTNSSELFNGYVPGLLFSPIPLLASGLHNTENELLQCFPQLLSSQEKAPVPEEKEEGPPGKREGSSDLTKKRSRDSAEENSDTDSDASSLGLPTTVMKKRLSNPQAGSYVGESPFTSFSNFLPET